MEKALLGQDELDEMLSADDLSSLMGMLQRWGWIVDEGMEDPGWEDVLTENLRQSDQVLSDMDSDGVVTALLVAQHDLLNLCAMLKARSLPPSEKPPLHRRGVHDIQTLESMVQRMDFSRYPDVLAEKLTPLREVLDGGGGREIANAVAGAHHRALKESALGEGSSLFADLLDCRADLENIKSKLRVLAFPEAWVHGAPLLPGGYIEGELLGESVDQDQLVRNLLPTEYASLLEKCREEDGRISLFLLEREGDNFLTEILEPAKYISFGPEPLWAYYFAREVDARNIRSVAMGLRSGSDREDVEMKLRRPYV